MEKKFERVKKRKADTPMRAIGAKCYDCCCDQANEIRLCPSKDCPLWKYRFGRRPKAEESKVKVLRVDKSVNDKYIDKAFSNQKN